MKNIDYRHIVQAEDIIPIKDHVLVQDMDFQAQVTKGGVLLPSDDGTGQGIRPRWGKVYSVGRLQKEVKPGEWVLVDHGRWTRGVLIQKPSGEELVLRRVDFKDILGTSDEPANEV
jgi:co-chaperonin GroES (HSP10)